MRWLGILLLTAWLLIPLPVMAQTSDTVTVTASGYVENPGSPINFAITYISDYEIQISWEKPDSVNLTMVRAAFGRVPTDREDGYLVYNGDGIATTDWVNLVVADEQLHYAAWCMDGEGDWSSQPATGFTEGVTMTYLVLGILALGLTIAMFISRQMMLGFPSAMMWAILGGFSYTRSTTAWGDWQYFLFIASAFGMTIFCMLAAYGLREKRESLAEKEIEKGEGGYVDEGEARERDRLDTDHLFDMEPEPSQRAREIRERAEKRRAKRGL